VEAERSRPLIIVAAAIFVIGIYVDFFGLPTKHLLAQMHFSRRRLPLDTLLIKKGFLGYSKQAST